MSLLNRDKYFERIFLPLVGKKVAFCQPMGNPGDDLIGAATRQLFEYFGITWTEMDYCNPTRPINSDILVYGGGGNMGTLWGLQGYRREVLAVCEGMRKILLPQSYHEPSPEEFDTVYLREWQSLEFCPKGIIAPDLALGYTLPKHMPSASESLGIALRDDLESKVIRVPDAFDPIVGLSDHMDYLALASRYDAIITDRLHFAICGLILGRRVTLLPNSYHKNRGMYESWLLELGCHWSEEV